MTEPIDRAAIKARAEAASAGPWELLGGGEYISPIGIIVAPDDGGVRPADAEFIAHAREDIPALLAALESAEREVAKITENRNEWASRMMELATTEQKLERAVRRIEAVEALVMTTDGDYLDGNDFDGLAGEILAALHPRASWHEYECTRSNEYGQVGTPTTESENSNE